MAHRSPFALVAAVSALLLASAGVNRHSLEGAMACAGARASPSGDSGRVAAARLRLKDSLPALFVAQNVSWPPRALFLRAIKEQDDGKPGVLEMWAQGKNQRAYTLIKSYPICALSGTLGPKRREGDMQIPEGFYTISRLNPQSNYHLSMRVDYPNASDRARARALDSKASLGGDIMVHGHCVTIGCIPIENEPIEEVYLAASAVFAHGPVSIHIFPRRLDAEGLASLLLTTSDEGLRGFWRELAAGYQGFEKTQQPPTITTAPDGAYQVN